MNQNLTFELKVSFDPEPEMCHVLTVSAVFQLVLCSVYLQWTTH